MLLCLFADIHANRQAYEAVIESFSRYNIDNFYCIGDIVGYGANPNECINLTRRINPYIVCGNHDWAAVDLTGLTYFNIYAKEAIRWTKENLDEVGKGYLKSLELVRQDEYLVMVHGTLDNPSEFDYIMDSISTKKTFEAMQTNLCFIGHSHRPEVFTLDANRIDYLYQDKIYLDERLKYIINVGSIGQPRDGDPRSSFVLFDTEEKYIEFKRVAYDIETAKNNIIKAGLPRVLADRLEVGR